MAFERARARSVAVGAVVVILLATLSVVSLAVAEGRLEQYHHNRTASAAASPSTATTATTATTAPTVGAAPATGPAPPTSTTTTATTTAAPGPPSGLLADLFASINADREANGLAPLTWDGRLSAAAQQATDDMAASGDVTQPDADVLLALGFARAGQTVLAAPHDVTAVSAEQSWISSTTQRTTILDPAFGRVGIGTTSSADGRIWIAADFGAQA